MASGRHYSLNDEIRRLLENLKMRVKVVKTNTLLGLLHLSEMLKIAHHSAEDS